MIFERFQQVLQHISESYLSRDLKKSITEAFRELWDNQSVASWHKGAFHDNQRLRNELIRIRRIRQSPDKFTADQMINECETIAKDALDY